MRPAASYPQPGGGPKQIFLRGSPPDGALQPERGPVHDATVACENPDERSTAGLQFLRIMWLMTAFGVSGVTEKNAIAFVKLHGIVLESAHGPVPNLAEAVAGERIRGGWWGHSQGPNIFAATRAVRNSPDVLVCRLLGGKVTYLHRRLWPAIVRLADKLHKTALAAIREEHTASGSHRVVTTPFPQWVPTKVKQQADRLHEEEAWSQLTKEIRPLLSAKRSRVNRGP
jgi:hypothetical protein